jgi:protein-S-isoprenylcysteine O-methyltransferase Ste14
MNKILTSIIIAGLMLYLPLLNMPVLMKDIRLLFPLIVSIWLLLKQEKLDLKKIKAHAKTDRYSTILIVLAGMLSQALPIVEWSFKKPDLNSVTLSIPILLGVLMLFGGLFIRLQAIETLGKNFTNEVRIESNGKLIKEGLYQYIRHPSYTGGYICMLGGSILFESYYSFLICLILLAMVYKYRIKFEETELIRHYGEVYKDYMKKTSAILPLLY